MLKKYFLKIKYKKQSFFTDKILIFEKKEKHFNL